MKRRDLIWLMCLALAGCNGKLPVQAPDDPTGTPVLFSSGNMTEALTKTDPDPLGSTSPYYHGMTNTSGVPYMPQGGRFVCTMYYHAAAGDTDASDFDVKDLTEGGTYTTAWLKVNNNVGNSVYWNNAYADVAPGDIDDILGFDKNATCFYWQNRLTHAFLALADYNQLAVNDGATTEEGKLKMYPYGDEEFPELGARQYVNAYDLTRGSRTSMAEQPDPILALTIMKPAGATQEANRVRLFFKHQFSQIQVNVKGADDNSANITTDKIEGVELLGVSETAYVCNKLMADGTVGAAFGKDVNSADYGVDVLENNKWGSSFQMFDMATGVIEDGLDKGYAIGFLKSYNAIAFGRLWAIRITWHEGTTEAPGVVHVSTFEVPEKNETNVYLQNLQSGVKYVYDLELRRGTLAVIRTEILDWDQKEDLVYSDKGTIHN